MENVLSPSNSSTYLYITIGFIVITLILYIIFLYIPVTQGENTFNDAITQANLAIEQAREAEEQIEDTNTLVNTGFTSFCEFYNTSPAAIAFFGDAFVEVCTNIT